jgi:nitronate monooxygenase
LLSVTGLRTVTAVSVSPLHRWPATRLAASLGIRHPIVQGPFGSGLSSLELAACVSESGGLGSFGVHHLEPPEIEATVAALRARTAAPFAVNLWVSTHDVPEAEITVERWDAAVAGLAPLYDELGVLPPARPERFSPTFAEQAEAVLAARPPVFSWVYGIPDAGLLDALRDRGIVTVGTAITVDEAVALDEAGVDVIVASGAEAGGHRVAFLDEPERSLVGTMALIPAVVDEVRAPVIAAGGIADARGIVAALALGADGVQIGTAFLATDQSAAPELHKRVLRSPAARTTRLTRAFTGRLARGIPNRALEELGAEPLPFPYQARLMRPLRDAAIAADDPDFVALWSGQAAPLLRERDAVALLRKLLADTDELLASPRADHA